MAINKNKVNDNALKFIQKGQIKKAIREYEKILGEDPNDVRTLLKKGDLQVRAGEKSEAVDTYLMVASAYSQQGFHLKAVAVFKQILKIDDGRVDVHLRLAEEYQNLGIASDAMTHLQIVADHHEQQGNIHESLDIFRRIVDISPENVASRIKLAELYSRENMVNEAVEEFAKAAGDLKSANRIEDYIKVAERLIYHDSTNIALIKELANIYLQRGDTKRALGKLQICFKADARDLETLNLLALAFQELNQLSKTVSVYKEMAKIHVEQGATAEAQQVYRRVLEIVPDDPEANQALSGQVESSAEPVGDITLERSFPGAAAKRQSGGEAVRQTAPEEEELDVPLDASAAVTTLPVMPASGDQSRETIARLLTETDVYIKYGLQNKAFEHLKKVFELDPDNIEGHEKLKDLYLAADESNGAVSELLLLARLAFKRGGKDQAISYLRTLLSIDSGNREAIALLGQLDGRSMSTQRQSVTRRVEVIEPEDEAVSEQDAPIEASEEEAPEIILADEENVIEVNDADEGVEVAIEVDPSADPMGARQDPEAEEVDPAVEEDLSLEGDVDAGGFQDEEVNAGGEQMSTMIADRADYFKEGDLEVAQEEVPVEVQEEEGFEKNLPDLPDFSDTANEASTTVNQAGDSASAELDEEPELIEIDDDAEFFEVEEVEEAGEEEGIASDIELPPPPVSDQGVSMDEEEFGEEMDLGERSTSLNVKNADPETQVLPSSQPESTKKTPMVDFSEDVAMEEDAKEKEDEGKGARETEGVGDVLEEVDFFLQQNLLEEAADALEALRENHPDHPEVLERIDKLNRLKKGDALAEPGAADELSGKFDLAAELEKHAGEEAASIPLDGDFQYSVDDVLSEFRKGVAKVVEKEDSATHFDLGIAYKEMGLLDDAIGEFSVAASDIKKRPTALTMIGLCFAEKGQFSEAINRFKDALHSANIGEEQATAVYFEIGQAYESLKDSTEALFYYRKVHKRDPKYRNVNERLQALLKSGAVSAKAEGEDPKNSSARASPNKISYM